MGSNLSSTNRKSSNNSNRDYSGDINKHSTDHNTVSNLKRLVINTNIRIGDGKLLPYEDGCNDVTFVIMGDNMIVTLAVDNNNDNNHDDKQTHVHTSVNYNINNNSQGSFDLQGCKFDKLIINGNSKVMIQDNGNFDIDSLVEVWAYKSSYTLFDNSVFGTTYDQLVIYAYDDCFVKSSNSNYVSDLTIKTHDNSQVSGFNAGNKARLNTSYGGNINITKDKFCSTNIRGHNIIINVQQ